MKTLDERVDDLEAWQDQLMGVVGAIRLAAVLLSIIAGILTLAMTVRGWS